MQCCEVMLNSLHSDCTEWCTEWFDSHVRCVSIACLLPLHSADVCVWTSSDVWCRPVHAVFRLFWNTMTSPRQQSWDCPTHWRDTFPLEYVYSSPVCTSSSPQCLHVPRSPVDLSDLGLRPHKITDVTQVADSKVGTAAYRAVEKSMGYALHTR